MAERRVPGFVIPLGFYDGPEVSSIPRRLRAAAIGVWALCGAYSANKLLDGYVGPEMLRQLGCTPAIRAALMATRGPDGQPDPLWLHARDGGIQFGKWVKYQRSRAEVNAYRNADAERKRNARKAAKGAVTSEDSEMSRRTSAKCPPDHREPKTKTKTISSYVDQLGQRNVDARDTDSEPAQAATRGADIVRRVIPNGHPSATMTALRIQASELLHTGTEPDVIERALRLWCDKPGVGIGRTILASLCSEVLKSRASPNGGTSGKPHKMRALAELAAEVHARETQHAKELPA